MWVSGDKGGEVLQSGESGRQTLGSLTWRTSNDGRVLRMSRSTGISLQIRVSPQLSEKILWSCRTSGLGRSRLQRNGYNILDLKTKSGDFSESGSIYTQTCCVSLAGKYDIYCLF